MTYIPVDIGHGVEDDSQVPKFTAIHVGDDAKGDEKVVDGDGRPADEEDAYYTNKHLDDL